MFTAPDFGRYSAADVYPLPRATAPLPQLATVSAPSTNSVFTLLTTESFTSSNTRAQSERLRSASAPPFAKGGGKEAVSEVVKACPSSAAPRHLLPARGEKDLENPLPLAGEVGAKRRVRAGLEF